MKYIYTKTISQDDEEAAIAQDPTLQSELSGLNPTLTCESAWDFPGVTLTGSQKAALDAFCSGKGWTFDREEAS